MNAINTLGLYLLLAIFLLVGLPIWVYVTDPFEKELLPLTHINNFFV